MKFLIPKSAGIRYRIKHFLVDSCDWLCLGEIHFGLIHFLFIFHFSIHWLFMKSIIFTAGKRVKSTLISSNLFPNKTSCSSFKLFLNKSRCNTLRPLSLRFTVFYCLWCMKIISGKRSSLRHSLIASCIRLERSTKRSLGNKSTEAFDIMYQLNKLSHISKVLAFEEFDWIASNHHELSQIWKCFFDSW